MSAFIARQNRERLRHRLSAALERAERPVPVRRNPMRARRRGADAIGPVVADGARAGVSIADRCRFVFWLDGLFHDSRDGWSG